MCFYIYSLDGHVLLFVVLDDIDVTLLFFFLCIADFLDYQYIYIYIYIYISPMRPRSCVFFICIASLRRMWMDCVYMFFFSSCVCYDGVDDTDVLT